MAFGELNANQSTDAITINDRSQLTMRFQGAATVKLQIWLNSGFGGGWIDVKDSNNVKAEWVKTGADTVADIVYAGTSGTRFRLSCTAAARPVLWELG